MRIAMGLAAAISITIGVVPGLLYGLLPFAVDYVHYTTSHVINQLQLRGLAAMAFTVLMRTGLYPPELRSVNLDSDVVYRRLLPAVWVRGQRRVVKLRDRMRPHVEAGLGGVATLVTSPLRLDGGLGSPWSTSGKSDGWSSSWGPTADLLPAISAYPDLVALPCRFRRR
jgi:multicomponent Na+:H+ antiporter subunit D